MMLKLKKLAATVALVGAAALAALGGMLSADLHAQSPAPGQFTSSYVLAAARTASGAASSSRNVAADKTYQVTASTASGTGTAVVTIEGTNDQVGWSTINTVTLTLSTTPATGSFSSADRFLLVRPNASTLTGSTATYTATMGY
jgi:hypothetical protein